MRGIVSVEPATKMKIVAALPLASTVSVDLIASKMSIALMA